MVKFKSYIAKFNEPMEDGTIFSNGCMDDCLGNKIPIYGDGFRDEKRISGYGVLCKDETGYFVECNVEDSDMKKKFQYAGFYGRVLPMCYSNSLPVTFAEPLRIGLFNHNKYQNCYKIEKENK